MLLNLLGLATILVFLGILFYYLVSPKHKQDTWKELAESLGLDYEAQNVRKGMLSARVSGEHRARPLHLHTMRSQNEFQTLYTQIQVPVENPAGHSLSVSQRNLFTNIVQRLGVNYTPTGEAEFDQHFVVVAKPAHIVRDLLGSPYLKQKLLRTRKLEIQLTGDMLSLRVRGYLNDLETLRAMVELTSEVAERIDKYTQA